MVEGIAPGVAPPSKMIATRPFKASCAISAVVAGGSAERLALLVAKGCPTARINWRVASQLGNRTAMSLLGESSLGKSGWRETIIVNGPGQ